jgi:polysaccharide export outer membrane protein
MVGIAFAQEEPIAPEAPPTQEVTPAQAAPAPVAPTSQILTSAEGDYVLSPGDTIEMTVFREPELNSRSAIARDGSVQLPLIREVKLAGLSVRDARALLTKVYSEKYLVNPQIFLSVTQFAQRKFTIMGQVANPGSYQLEGGQSLSLLEAIGMAGGFTRIADRGRVLVRRGAAADNQAFKLNAKRMAEGKVEMFEILPGDIITVGESWF